MAKVMGLLVTAYQVLISPWLGNNCRYYPSCSDYLREALQVWGAGRGSYLAVKRLARCHPWCAGGMDPVPSPRTAEER